MRNVCAVQVKQSKHLKQPKLLRESSSPDCTVLHKQSGTCHMLVRAFCPHGFRLRHECPPLHIAACGLPAWVRLRHECLPPHIAACGLPAYVLIAWAVNERIVRDNIASRTAAHHVLPNRSREMLSRCAAACTEYHVRRAYPRQAFIAAKLCACCLCGADFAQN